MKRNNKKGFTITELVIVIAVIAILAAVLIPTFSGVIKKAKLSNDTQVASRLNQHIEVYCIENGLNKKEFLGTDVISIAEVGNYNLKPSTGEWTYVWNIAERKVEIMQKSSEEGGDWVGTFTTSPVDPTNIFEGYYMIGKGDSDIEQAIYTLINATNEDAYEKAKKIYDGQDQTNKYLEHVTKFNPDHTLYLTNTNCFGATGEALKVVYTLRTFNVDTNGYTGSIQANALNSVSQIVKTYSSATNADLKAALRAEGAKEVGFSVNQLVTEGEDWYNTVVDVATGKTNYDVMCEMLEDAGVKVLEVEEMVRVNQNNIPGITFNFGSSVVGTSRQEIVLQGNTITVLYFSDAKGLVAFGKMFNA